MEQNGAQPEQDTGSDSVGSDTGTDSDSDSGGASCITPIPLDDEIVVTLQGAVRGTPDDGALAFKGIPFAAPPLGALRGSHRPRRRPVWTASWRRTRSVRSARNSRAGTAVSSATRTA
jgi:hypothetical protein